MGQDYPPIHTHTRDAIMYLTRQRADLRCFIGLDTTFSFRVATTDWEHKNVSWLVTGDCCRGLKCSASPAYRHKAAMQDFVLQKMHFRKAQKV